MTNANKLFVHSIFQIAVLLTAAGLAAATPAHAGASVTQGDYAYRDGQFDETIKLYKKALSSGVINGHVYYNLGNAFFRAEHYGKAIASYRRALRLLPQDPDVRVNLKLARDKSIDDIQSHIEPSPLQQLTRPFLEPFLHFTSFTLKICALLGFFCFALLTALRPLAYPRWLNICRFAMIPFTLYWGTMALCVQSNRLGEPKLALSSTERSIRAAVVSSPELNVHSGNSQDFQVVLVLHDGAEIETNEQRGDWVQLLLPNGRRGWAKKEFLEIL